jgi:hypothetical protein
MRYLSANQKYFGFIVDQFVRHLQNLIPKFIMGKIFKFWEKIE